MDMSESKPKHIIFLDSDLNIRAGGPSGYLANLQLGLSQIATSSVFELQISSKEGELKKKQISFPLEEFYF